MDFFHTIHIRTIAYDLHASVAAVYRHDISRHIGGSRRCQENRCRIQLALLAISLQRNHCLRIFLEKLAVQRFLRERRIEVSGADRVHCDPVFSPLCCQRSRQIHNTALRRMITLKSSNVFSVLISHF